MERRIGEIFEFGDKWYQCVEDEGCEKCDLRNIICRRDIFIFPFKACSSNFKRTDKKSVIFKKLGKVGEPFSDERFGLVQKYELKMYDYNTKDKRVCFADGYDVFVKIKQNKEDMGEKNDICPYDELFSPGTVSNTKHLAKEDMEKKKLKLKPFDIQKAREGKPVCTRDGHKARIICFDGKGDQPIIALVEAKGNKDALIEKVERYFINGHSVFEVRETNNDLMMLPEKKEGWVNVYKESIYNTKEEAIKATCDGATYIDTIKFSWEE